MEKATKARHRQERQKERHNQNHQQNHPVTQTLWDPVTQTRAGAGHLPNLMMGPPQAGGGGALCVPAEVGGVYGVVRLSPPPQPARLLSQPACIALGLRSGLRWLKRSGDDLVGCG